MNILKKYKEVSLDYDKILSDNEKLQKDIAEKTYKLLLSDDIEDCNILNEYHSISIRATARHNKNIYDTLYPIMGFRKCLSDYNSEFNKSLRNLCSKENKFASIKIDTDLDFDSFIVFDLDIIVNIK